MNNKIKVAGYAKKIQYGENIEYTNFSPDIVGFQLASNGGTPLFTLGSFNITTNLDPKLDKYYNISKFSNYLTLNDLNVSLTDSITLLSDNAGVFLNLDRTNLDYYALFGSLSEYIRVALEDIIINWPASLYVTPTNSDIQGNLVSGVTFTEYTYDTLYEIATFKIDTDLIINRYGINYLTNGTIINTFSETNDLRNMTVNFDSYVIFYNNIEYPIINFTAATDTTNNYIHVSVKGDPFSSLTSFTPTYHVKPKKIIEETFFNSLPNFQAYLLNRQITPKYTATFKYPTRTETGVILYVTDTLTWPVSDGYNIDFDTDDYVNYATRLFDLANSNDLFSSKLLNRFLVSESITSFDTTPVHVSDSQEDTSGGKMNKTLQIYGVEFDKINEFITGIQFANVVSYDKQNNTPDAYLKNLARILGWELVTSVFENDLLANYVTTSQSTYSGQSVGYTPVEADIELWRRIILNSPWIWKSKGARKTIEFFLRFIGTPEGLITFNEHIYKANGPINVDFFKQILQLQGLDDDISQYPIDSEGYPKPLPNTQNMYFQNNGLWYRETGGTGSTIDILDGNNPHVGPYDGGSKYMNQFRWLIPDFSAVTATTITSNTTDINLYNNYDFGTFNVDTGTTVDTVQIVSQNNIDFTDCVIFTPTIQPDPNPVTVYNDCGCVDAKDDKIMSLCIERIVPQTGFTCSNLLDYYTDVPYLGLYEFSFYQYDINGNVFVDSNNEPIHNNTAYVPQECCLAIGGTPQFYIDYENTSNVVLNSGYICCNANNNCGCIMACGWMVDLSTIMLPPLSDIYSGPQTEYLQFITQGGSSAIVTPDGCNCLPNYTTPVPNVYDPYTGQYGVGCQLTQQGIDDMALGLNSYIYNHYLARKNNEASCFNEGDVTITVNNIILPSGESL